MYVDGAGRRLEVITLDRGHGPQQVIRASWGRFLLGEGYYDDPGEAVKLLDAESAVEVLEFPQR